MFLFAQPQNFTAQYTSARNSLRLLTRILPFFFEQNTDGLIDKFFFQNRIPSGKQDEQDFVVTHLGDKEVNETLAHVMISTLIDGTNVLTHLMLTAFSDVYTWFYNYNITNYCNDKWRNPKDKTELSRGYWTTSDLVLLNYDHYW